MDYKTKFAEHIRQAVEWYFDCISLQGMTPEQAYEAAYNGFQVTHGVLADAIDRANQYGQAYAAQLTKAIICGS